MSYTATGDPPRHRYTVADYHRMGEVGIFAPDTSVELIDGEIIDMVPLYARRGVPEAWVLEAERWELNRYREPLEGTYRRVDTSGLAEPLGVEHLPGLRVDLRTADSVASAPAYGRRSTL